MSEWISIKEKMPDCDDFLAYSMFGEVEVGFRKFGYILADNNPHLEWDGSFVRGFARWGGRPIDFTHWMPVPKPPKGGK